MEKEIFTALVAKIKAEVPEIKKIGRFNNQFVHLLSAHPDENPFQFPALFLELRSHNFKDHTQGDQDLTLSLTTHLGFKSQLTDDLTVFDIKQRVFKAIHFFQYGNFGKFLRRDEEPSYDHPNVEVYRTMYTAGGNDYTGRQETYTATTTLNLTVSGLTQYL